MSENSQIVQLPSGTAADALSRGDMEIVSSQSAEERYSPELRESLENAKEIFGPYFLGPREIREAFKITLEPDSVPKIPFTDEELRQARALEQRLLLRINKTTNGEPITMRWLDEQFLPYYSDEEKKVVLQSMGQKPFMEGHYFFEEDVPRVGWALVSRNKIASGRTYIGQTQRIVDYLLTNNIFGKLKSSEIPNEYAEAFEEFESKKENLMRLIASNDIFSIPGGLENLTQLKISKLTRHSAVEVLYDSMLSLKSYFSVKSFNGERVLTSSLGPHNLLLTAGEKSEDQIVIGETGANIWEPKIASYLSRRANVES